MQQPARLVALTAFEASKSLMRSGGILKPSNLVRGRGCITSTPKSDKLAHFWPFLAKIWTGFLYTPSPKTQNAPTWQVENTPRFGAFLLVFVEEQDNSRCQCSKFIGLALELTQH